MAEDKPSYIVTTGQTLTEAEAEDWRDLWVHVSRHLPAMYAPAATPMADVPPALRGPRWAW